MSDLVLQLVVRDRTGKGGARQARRDGMVPGVIYGGKLGPVPVSVPRKELMKGLHTGKLLRQMIEIESDGKRQSVIAQDVQLHPVTEVPLHIDLYRVEKDQLIKVEVNITFINEEDSPGLKRGGALNVVRHEVELLVPAGSIPDELIADLTGLKIGDNLKISDITMPEGAEPTITDRDFTIATITSRISEEEVEGDAEEVDAGDVEVIEQTDEDASETEEEADTKE